MKIFHRNRVTKERLIKKRYEQPPHCSWCLKPYRFYENIDTKESHWERDCFCDQPVKLGDLETIKEEIIAAIEIAVNPPSGE